MSWEDCGFKPGKIYGDAKCARKCGDCDGEHHFYIGTSDSHNEEDEPLKLPEGLDPNVFFCCRHCETYADAIDDDEDLFVPTLTPEGMENS